LTCADVRWLSSSTFLGRVREGWRPTLRRTQVHEYDCLLLEHVFGQRPDDAHKVKAYVLENIASDPSLQQTELLFLGLFGRACRVMDSGNKAVRPRPGRPRPCGGAARRGHPRMCGRGAQEAASAYGERAPAAVLAEQATLRAWVGSGMGSAPAPARHELEEVRGEADALAELLGAEIRIRVGSGLGLG